MRLALTGGGALLVVVLILDLMVRGSVSRGQERQASEAAASAERCRDGYVWVRAYPQSYCAAGYVP